MDPELQALLEHERFDAVEDLWVERVDAAPSDVRFFTDAADAMLRSRASARLDPLLQLWIEALRTRGDATPEVAFYRALLRDWPEWPPLRRGLLDALPRAHADAPNVARVLAHFHLAESPDLAVALTQVDAWLRYDGRVVVVTGRGTGRVVEINLALGTLRIEFDDGTRLSFRLAEAERLVVPLASDHILLEKRTRPEALRDLAESDPGALLERVFAHRSAPVTLGELKEILSGIVAEERWATWWKRARADPRVASTGGSRPQIRWSASSADAETAVRQAFTAAGSRAKLEIARREASRSKSLLEFFTKGVAILAHGAKEPALALEASLTLERLPGSPVSANRAAALLEGDAAESTILGVEDRGLRERALVLLRDLRSDWAEIYARLLHEEGDARTLTFLYESLASHPELRDRILDDTLGRPLTAPRLFVWLVREARRRPELEARADGNLLRRILDAVDHDAFKSARATLRESLDTLGLELAARATREHATALLSALQRDGIEEHRRAALRAALMDRYPDLRPQEDVLVYTTAAALERKRAEFEQVTRVDIPRNAEEIRKAAAHGDLRENFEYKAARERHEMLSSRAKTLHDDLGRARILDPDDIDASRVRVGTRVTLAPTGRAKGRTLVILGPWDSDPGNGVVSYLAPAVQPLLGKKPGDPVHFVDEEFTIADISVWRSA